MRNHISKPAQAAAAIVALFAGAVCQPALATTPYGGSAHRPWHRAHHRIDSGDITVKKSAPRAPIAYAPDAFHGPAAIITAPVYIAGTFVSLPFRALEIVFPPNAQDPRVLIGAPLHFAGQIATFPFSTVNGAFGAQSNYRTYN